MYCLLFLFFLFFFNATATTEIYTLSLHTLFRSLSGAAGRATGRPIQRSIRTYRQCRYGFGVAVAAVERVQRRNRAGRRHSVRSEEHTSELQSQSNLVCRLLLEKKKKQTCSHLIQ